MRLSVVVPVLNEERHLGLLLSDIRCQSQRPDEIIVVDAGSSDATVRIAERAPWSSTASRPSRVAGTWEAAAR